MSESQSLDHFIFNASTPAECTISTTLLLAVYAKVKRTAKSETVTWLNKEPPKNV